MKKPASFILFILLAFNGLQAQSDRKLRLQAEAAMENKDWFAASQYYNRLHNHDSSDIATRYAYAEASFHNFDLDLSLRLFRKVIAADNGKRYPLSFYRVGQILKGKEQYKEAKKWFLKFSRAKIKRQRYDVDYYVTKSKLEAEACDLAQILRSTSVIEAPEHLDSTINSKLSEYAAFEKDSTLYFSSVRAGNSKRRDPNEVNYSKIYRTDFRKQKWSKIKALDTAINATYLHNANTCFSRDNKQMIVSRCVAKNASDYACELYVSLLINNRWKPLMRMDEPVNLTGYTTTQPCFGEIDGKEVLFFSSNRPGGRGGLDIWYAYREKDGSFSNPVNAGDKVNTPDDEITPWYVSKQKTLYFSSTWHPGLGGFDIFRSAFTGDSLPFSPPQNVGYPINSSYNDIYYSMNNRGDRVYLSSNRVGSFFENKLNCCNDIYRFAVNPVQEVPPAIDTAALITGQMKLLVPLTLYFHNDEPDPKTTNTVTTRNYQATYVSYMDLQNKYRKEFSAGLDGDGKEQARFKIENFFADSVDAGMRDLRKFSDLLLRTLRNGETVKITMKGYCSPLASTDYNVNLAKRRISSLRNYFMEKDNGVFVKYVTTENPAEGKLIFEDVDVGELPASRVSDDFKDKRNSVYSPSAASERKIQIIAVSFGK